MNPIGVCELLVGLPDVTVLGVDDQSDGPLRVHVETRTGRPPCPGCGGVVWVKDHDEVALVDLAALGRPSRLMWHRWRWVCPDASCPIRSFTEQAAAIAPARGAMTDRAGRWVCAQVGRLGRTVAEVARELGCDWHTVNDAVIAYGTALVGDDPERIGEVTALGLDETLFCRQGRWRTQRWCTSLVDVTASGGAQLLDVVAGRSAAGPSRWLESRPEAWRQAIRFGVLDLSGPYRKVYDDVLPDAIQDVDPVNRHRVNVGTVAVSPIPPPSQGGGGQVHRRLMTPQRGGGSVAVRVRESRAHGEGTQRVCSVGIGMPGGRR